MNKAVNKDLNRSNRLFKSKVWPRIGCKLGGGELINVENDNSPLAKLLDINAGIDFIQKTESGDLISIANRINYCNSFDPFNTFTIRHQRSSGVKTELNKRKNNRKKFLGPNVTVQSYFHRKKEDLLSLAVVMTEDLINYIDNGKVDVDYYINTTTESDDRKADFVVVDWQYANKQGLDMGCLINHSRKTNPKVYSRSFKTTRVI